MCSMYSDSNKQANQIENGLMLDNAFWQFSLSLYGKPEAASFCLALQDQHEMQVNLLLYSIWLSFEGCILEPSLIKQNSQLQNALTQIIPAIRHARKKAGENSKQDPLYKQLKACELSAEQQAQALLFQCERIPFDKTLAAHSSLSEFNYLLKQNLNICWQGLTPSAKKNPQPRLINEFSEWMIIHCQRKIAANLNIK